MWVEASAVSLCQSGCNFNPTKDLSLRAVAADFTIPSPR